MRLYVHWKWSSAPWRQLTADWSSKKEATVKPSQIEGITIPPTWWTKRSQAFVKGGGFMG